jgi:cystathionine beta-lyase/cystathionine gamma-synthase
VQEEEHNARLFVTRLMRAFGAKRNGMDALKQYLERAAETIGVRSPGQERYDREVVRWLERGKSVRNAISKANRKYPKEALKVDKSSLADVEAHYEYLAKHEQVLRALNSRET